MDPNVGLTAEVFARAVPLRSDFIMYCLVIHTFPQAFGMDFATYPCQFLYL